MSCTDPFASAAIKLVAWLSNATNTPSLEIEGFQLAALPCTPAESTLTRTVVALWRSRTKMSWKPLVSPATRFVAKLVNATKRPAEEIARVSLLSFPGTPVELMLTSVVWPAATAQTITTPIVAQANLDLDIELPRFARTRRRARTRPTRGAVAVYAQRYGT